MSVGSNPDNTKIFFFFSSENFPLGKRFGTPWLRDDTPRCPFFVPIYVPEGV